MNGPDASHLKILRVSDCYSCYSRIADIKKSVYLINQIVNANSDAEHGLAVSNISCELGITISCDKSG